MIDIHSHLLYGVDDGAKTIEESLTILKNLSEIGYKKIILTPHYIDNTRYNSPKSENIKRLNILKEELKKNKIDLEIYLGNEIYIDDNIEEFLKNNLITTLNDSNYLLIELPMSGEYANYKEILNDLIRKDYKIILAHPERYLSFQKDFHKIEELEDLGVYFQSNMESILDRYGKGAKKTFKRLLKGHKINYLGTDIHHHKDDYQIYLKAKSKILKYISEEEYQKLVSDNARKIINS